MAKILLEPWDIFIHLEERWVGMVLPCGKVITYEVIEGKVRHATAPVPTSGHFKVLDNNDLPNEIKVAPEIIIALKCARSAICIEKQGSQ